MASKEKPLVIVTPPGIAKYPRLNKPETEVGGKPCKPRFKVTVVFDEADKGVPEFKQQVEALYEAALVKARAEHKASKNAKKPLVENLTILPHMEDDVEVEGKFEIRAATMAFFEDKKTGQQIARTVPVYDAKGVPVKGKNIGGGSKMRLSITPNAYNGPLGAGLSFYLNGVKVLDLVEFSGGGSAKALGFGEDEEGYSSAADASDGFGEGPDETPADEPAKEEAAPAKTPRKKGDF